MKSDLQHETKQKSGEKATESKPII